MCVSIGLSPIWWQAEETLRVIMERQKKQREDIIFQVQRYKKTLVLFQHAIKVSHPPIHQCH